MKKKLNILIKEKLNKLCLLESDDFNFKKPTVMNERRKRHRKASRKFINERVKMKDRIQVQEISFKSVVQQYLLGHIAHVTELGPRYLSSIFVLFSSFKKERLASFIPCHVLIYCK